MTARAWFVICMEQAKPDGPGRVFGPFASKELALADVSEADGTFCALGNTHIAVFGPGGGDVLSSNSAAWRSSYQYFNDHPAEIPESCVSMFKCVARERAAINQTMARAFDYALQGTDLAGNGFDPSGAP